ncbi:MAG: LacI family DNA-binding transcriptional regulator [Chloroflexi bacterium]|nr:LacI family DNA-binding transcriptional regulator [Chloroflexota bacterium]
MAKPTRRKTEDVIEPVTAQHVAELAGVSPSTVSRVLNDIHNDFISEKTRSRVREAAAQLGYTPNPLARALRGRQSYLLGVIVRDIADPFFARMISELSTGARALGYRLVLGHAQNDGDTVLTLGDLLDIRQTDGVIVLGNLRDDDSSLEELFRRSHKVVTLCRAPASRYSVGIDNRAGVRAIMDHLWALGHRRIAFIDAGWQGDINERREAYLAYLHERSRSAWIEREVNTPAGGSRAMQALIAAPERPTAVFASDDIVATGALKAALESGLRVPQDISIVGFDDIELAQYLSPALTTMRQPIEVLSREALRLLTTIITDSEIREEVLVRITPELVVRQSSGPAPDA